MFTRRILLLIIFGVHSFSLAYGEENTISFDDIVKRALEKSLTIAKIDSTLASRIGDSEEVQLKKNPILDSQVRLPGNRPSSQNEYQFQLSQPLRLSDFGVRTRVASLIREEASLAKKLALVEFMQNLALLYRRVWIAQERRSILLKSQRSTKQIVKDIKKNSELGYITEGDGAMFEGEAAQIESDLLGASIDINRKLTALSDGVGSSFENVNLAPPPIRYIPSKDELRLQLREATLPVQERARLLHKVTSEQLELAKLDAVRPISPNLGFQRISDGGEQVTLGLSIELPLFDRNQAQTLRALGAERSAFKLTQLATDGTLESQALNILQAIETIRKQIELYRKKITPLRERALEAYQRQYQLGQSNIMTIWQAQRELINVKSKELELSLMEQELVSELSILLGEAF